MSEKFHKPIMVSEIIEHLKPAKGKVFLDATLGDGGHTLEFLKRGCKVIGLDVSTNSLNRAKNRLKDFPEFSPIKANFKSLEQVSMDLKIKGFDGILFDLGYSQTQLEDDLGLSFLRDQPLDMRLDDFLGVKAADLLNSLTEKDIERLIRDYSDELLARKFAHEIVNFRKLKKFQTTKDLSDLLKSVAPLGYENGRIHPATRVFQALRIVVNDEFENLKIALPQAARLLLPGGRMALITFHSTEDRLVKQTLLDAQLKLTAVTKKPVTPDEAELKENNSARSAKLRVYERY